MSERERERDREREREREIERGERDRDRESEREGKILVKSHKIIARNIYTKLLLLYYVTQKLVNYRDTGVSTNVEYDFKKMLYIFRIIERFDL